MTSINSIIREAKFAAGERSVVVWFFIVFFLTSLSLWFGIAEVDQQNKNIQYLRESDQQDRQAELSKVKDWGSAAYYSFHLTYDAPSDFAFAALGQRDFQPWKHRIRMLALEGQIYERDTVNPVIALIGRFDFAFLAAFIIPLILIMLLYDLKSRERVAGRHDLLEVSSGKTFYFWFTRVLVRTGAVLTSLIVPFVFTGLVLGTTPSTMFIASVFVIVYAIFWSMICYWCAAWRKSGSVILMTLISVWLTLTVILPFGSRLAIDRLVPIPSGSDILLLQRETVNDAWDLPREATMKPFFERHPEWSDYMAVQSSFEWPWYYAFQQLGDQKTEILSKAYREGRLKRDRFASWVSVFTPPSLFERSLQGLAKTDLNTAIEYEEKVRAFHVELRAFYYPKFFRNEPFDPSALIGLPEF